MDVLDLILGHQDQIESCSARKLNNNPPWSSDANCNLSFKARSLFNIVSEQPGQPLCKPVVCLYSSH